MVPEPGFTGAEQAAPIQPRLIATKFGGEIPSGVTDANDYFVKTYLAKEAENGGYPQLVGMTTVIPQRKGLHKFWDRRPLRSVTFFAFSSANTPEDTGGDASLQIKSIGRLTMQLSKGGNVRNALLSPEPSEESVVQNVVKITKGYHYIVEEGGGKTEVPVLIVDRKVQGQTGIDRLVIAPYVREDAAKKGLEYFNERLSTVVGKGEILDTNLRKVVEQDVLKKKGRRYSSVVKQALHHLGKIRAMKKDNKSN